MEKQNHVEHYCVGGIETIDYIRAKLTPEQFIGFCLGNVLKYISRAGHKDNNSEYKDLIKTNDYLDWAIDMYDEMIKQEEEWD